MSCYHQSNNESVPGETARRPQEELDTYRLWLIMELDAMRSANPAFAGRLKAAALQLLPPVLDGLDARRLSGKLHVGLSATESLAQTHIELNLVGTPSLLPAQAWIQSACLLHR